MLLRSMSSVHLFWALKEATDRDFPCPAFYSAHTEKIRKLGQPATRRKYIDQVKIFSKLQ